MFLSAAWDPAQRLKRFYTIQRMRIVLSGLFDLFLSENEKNYPIQMEQIGERLVVWTHFLETICDLAPFCRH